MSAAPTYIMNRQFLRACFPTARSTDRTLGRMVSWWCDVRTQLSGQFLRLVSEKRAVGPEKGTDLSQRG